MNEPKNCPFCGGRQIEEIVVERKGGAFPRRFFCCTCGCGGIFVPSDCFLPKQRQKERYLLHRNLLSDSAYRSFLRAFADTAFEQAHSLLGSEIRTIFDYGCGYSRALMQLLENDKKSGVLDSLVKIRGWDPIFFPLTEFFTGGADLVLCLEVAEHFENPSEDFAALARACRSGGVLALHTLLVPNAVEDFKRWWYKEDTTHVSFYTKKALIACGEKAGFEFCGLYNNCSIFRAALAL